MATLIPDGEVAPATTTTETEAQEQAQTQAPTTTTDEVKTDTDAKVDTETPAEDNKEWFKADKYKTVDDQAKAYTELEKKFGSFTGAPKDGKYEIEGIDFENNPLMNTVAQWGAEQQLSAKGLESLVQKVNELATKQQEEDTKAALEALGEKGTERINNLAQWGQNNLAPEEYKQFQGLAQTAGQVEVLEKLIGMTKNSKLVDKTTVNGQDNNASTEEDLKAMYLATNKNGQRLMDVDAAYRIKVNNAYKAFYGQ